MTIAQASPEIWHRDDFSLLCNWRKLFTAVEVGVDRGEFAQEFLQHWRGHCYVGIDEYLSYPEMNYERESDYLIALNRIERHARIAKLIRESSQRATEIISDSGILSHREFDFVYIDAAHDEINVIKDLERWWPLVSEIGILAGHDFDEMHPGVVKAVSQFASYVGRDLYVTTNDGPCFSWYIYKNGMPGPDWRRC